MALLIDLIVGAVGDFLGGLGNDLLKDAQKRAAFAKCLGAALEAVNARYAELVYARFLDQTFFQQETVVKELAKLLSRSGEPDIKVLFEQYRQEWQNPDDAPPEGRAAIQLFVDELRKCLWSSPEFRQELDSQALEKTVGAAERSEILLKEAVALLHKLVKASAAKPAAGPQRVMSNLYKLLERSGGVTVKGDSVEITGDIAGRDIVQVFLTGLNAPDAGRGWEYALWKEYGQATRDLTASATDVANAVRLLSKQLRPPPARTPLAPPPALTGNARLLTWQEIEDAGVRMADPLKSAKNFYNAARPTWGNIYHEHDARRDSQDDILQWLATQSETCVALVLAAGGDGKTTMLMRLAADLAHQGQPVIWRGSGDYMSWDMIAPYANDSVTVVADYAHQLDGRPESKGNLSPLINHCQSNNLPVRFVLAARKNEWGHARIELGRVPKKIVDWTQRSQRLSHAEAGRILDKLEAANELGKLTGKPRDEQIRLFVESTEGQLLAALIAAKGGGPFRLILESVASRIGEWPDGAFVLRTLQCACAVHQWDAYVTCALLAECMDTLERDIDDRILKPLEGEIAELEESDGRIRTRHAIIAQVLFSILSKCAEVLCTFQNADSPMFVPKIGLQKVERTFDDLLSGHSPQARHSLRRRIQRGRAAQARTGQIPGFQAVDHIADCGNPRGRYG